MTTITLSELPETLQNLLQQIAQTGETLTITQGDQTLAIISPITKNKRAAFGSMKSETKILGDILEQVYPVDPDFDPDQAKADYLAEKHSL
jgi:antitoxin (DNA-binding transcriptional repressor) of toxin-antitoxin stability system